MGMTTGAYILLQNPLTNGYPYLECIRCCLDIFDEILIVDGGTTDGSFDLLPKDDRIRFVKRDWPEDAGWDFLTQQYDCGLQNLTTDWRVKIDADYIFHENDIPKIKEVFQKYSNEIGINFEKSCFNLVDRYRSKSKILLAINKKLCPDIHWNTKDELESKGKVYSIENTMVSGIKLYVYDSIFKTKENIGNVMYKWALAVKGKYDMNWGYESKENALQFFINSSKSRLESHHQNVIKLEDHPKYIRDKIRNMTEDMAGYSLFGYKKAVYFEN